MSDLDIILASGSESRRMLLANAGVEARSIKPNVDEDVAKVSFRAEKMRVADQAMRLAEMKAVKVSQRHEGLVIGGDQMLNGQDLLAVHTGCPAHVQYDSGAGLLPLTAEEFAFGHHQVHARRLDGVE